MLVLAEEDLATTRERASKSGRAQVDSEVRAMELGDKLKRAERRVEQLEEELKVEVAKAVKRAEVAEVALEWERGNSRVLSAEVGAVAEVARVVGEGAERIA